MSETHAGDLEDLDVNVDSQHSLRSYLDNHSETWTDPESRVFWLRDLLPAKLPEARILTYGYKAEALASDGEGTSDQILPHAKTLVADLYAHRYLSNATSRPIIFICHGLGGILVKRALAYSNTSRAKQVQHRRSIFTATYGIIFFGTPHNGMSETALQAEASLMPTAALSQLSSALAKTSHTLQDISDQFAPLTKRFSIYLFWEQLETRFGTTNVYVVDHDSADPGWESAERAGLDADHSQMCKFVSENDGRFKLVLSACKRYIQDAPRVVRARWNEDRELLAMERKQEAAEMLRHDSGLSISGGPSPTRNVHFIVRRSASSLFTGRVGTANLLRQKIVSTLSGKENHQHKIFVIWGLGGSGKTQFCLKFIEDNRDSFWGVFWIDATTDATAEMGFAELGGLAKKDTTFEAGMHWLSNCREPWLLVIDNADDCNMDVSRYFPAGGRGHIILTTRNPNNVVHATIGEASFREMDEEEAITLLLRAARQPGAETHKDKTQRNLARPITSALGYLAIAIIHAGATIRRQLYTLEEYLLVYEKELMTQRLLPPTSSIERTITATYEIPFSATMKRTDLAAVDAAQILHIFAFLHFQQIPEAIFRQAWNNLQSSIVPEPEEPKLMLKFWSISSNKDQQPGPIESQNLPSLLHAVTWDDRRFHDALAVLYDLSFIHYDNSKKMCWMHPMVRLWAQNRLQPEEKKYWLETATNVVAHSISPVSACLQSWQSDAKLMASGYIYRSHAADRFASVYAEVGDWERSREINEKLLSIRKKEVGPENSETLRVMSELGKIYWNLFQVGQAVQIRSEICSTRLKVLGEEHSLTLSAVSDLASAYWLAGDRAKSLSHGQNAASGLSRNLGLNDPTTLTAIFNLARTQFHLGQLEAARVGLEQVLNAQQTFFGTKHPETLMSMAELGVVYHALRRTDKAEHLLRKVLKARTDILGEEHAYTLWTVNDLSKVYTDSGRAKLALEMLDAMIPVVVRTLGKRHVGMHMTKFNLARAYSALGRWRDAEKVLIKQMGRLVSLHPDYIAAVIELAWVYKNLKQNDEAEKLYLEALELIITSRERGVNQIQVCRVATQLEEIYEETDQAMKVDSLKNKVASLATQG
ncbi:hypothetical protein EG329_008186 [Mollisiaceae sp. DMI_Dod_QoI]|nr:hypothetical protein EG329_008186 [Helotiales sp. DMI_Dod_QoI]